MFDSRDTFDIQRNNLFCRQILKELTDVLNSDRSPLCSQQPPVILDPSIQRQLTHFSLVTHGFGSPVITAAVNAVDTFLAESLKYIDRVSGSQSTTSSTPVTAVTSGGQHQRGQQPTPTVDNNATTTGGGAAGRTAGIPAHLLQQRTAAPNNLNTMLLQTAMMANGHQAIRK